MFGIVRTPWTALLTLGTAGILTAAEGGLSGTVEGDTYTSSNRSFSVRIPVLPELGGTITDTEYVASFEDSFTTYLSIAALPLDDSQRREDTSRGRKDYLVYFYTNFVLPDFVDRYPGTTTESARFLPSLQDGALLTYQLVPGGSMVAGRARFGSGAPEDAVAKRGNLIFVNSDHIFVLSTELVERVLEGSVYDKTPEEEDAIIRQRLLNLLDQITFMPGRSPANLPALAGPDPAQ